MLLLDPMLVFLLSEPSLPLEVGLILASRPLPVPYVLFFSEFLRISDPTFYFELKAKFYTSEAKDSKKAIIAGTKLAYKTS